MTHVKQSQLVLSIYPTSRGYAFTVFDGPLSLYDWGIKEVRKKDKNEQTLKHIKALLKELEPDHLVIEDYTEKGSRRSSRIKRLYRALEQLAKDNDIVFKRYMKQDILKCFASDEAHTKYEVAKAIARELPELAHRLPKPRKIWMSEDPRQSLFDAAALGMVFFVGKDGEK